ncbi:unnamed protein product [Ectocarpus sp. CCAP 1310/34]|nr:unnamed protein product [Ectocarpus sp. CCAP 1310/34]
MTALLAGTNLSTGGDDEEDEQDQGGGGENTGRECRAPRAPPGYEELSSHFGALEVAAEDSSGNGDAAFYLTKAKMSTIVAHSARRVRQTLEDLSRRRVHGCFFFLRFASCRVLVVFILFSCNIEAGTPGRHSSVAT